MSLCSESTLCSENTLCSEAPGPADCEGSLCMLAWACPGVESSVGMVMSLWYPEDAREANRPADTKYSIADYSDKLKTQKKKKKSYMTGVTEYRKGQH